MIVCNEKETKRKKIIIKLPAECVLTKTKFEMITNLITVDGGGSGGGDSYSCRTASSEQIRLVQYKLIVNERRVDVFEMSSN